MNTNFQQIFLSLVSYNRIGTTIPALNLIDKKSAIFVNNNNDSCHLLCKCYALGTMLRALPAMSIRTLSAVRVAD